MRRSAVIRALVAFVAVGLLAAGVCWLWMSPLASIPSKAAIGKLNLEQVGAVLHVRFVPPKQLSSITIVFGEHVQGTAELCTHPDFPLSLRVSVCDLDGNRIVEDLIPKDRMQWTNWHEGESLRLMLHGWLGDRLSSDSEYDLALSVDSAVADIGQAEVFLHWMDLGYVWGREKQELRFTTSATE